MGQRERLLAHLFNRPLDSERFVATSRSLHRRARISFRRAPVKAATATAVRAGEVVNRLRNFLSRGETEFKVESLSQLTEETSRLTFPDATLDSVLIDRIHIQHALLNLMRNTFEAM